MWRDEWSQHLVTPTIRDVLHVIDAGMKPTMLVAVQLCQLFVLVCLHVSVIWLLLYNDLLWEDSHYKGVVHLMLLTSNINTLQIMQWLYGHCSGVIILL